MTIILTRPVKWHVTTTREEPEALELRLGMAPSAAVALLPLPRDPRVSSARPCMMVAASATACLTPIAAPRTSRLPRLMRWLRRTTM